MKAFNTGKKKTLSENVYISYKLNEVLYRLVLQCMKLVSGFEVASDIFEIPTNLPFLMWRGRNVNHCQAGVNLTRISLVVCGPQQELF